MSGKPVNIQELAEEYKGLQSKLEEVSGNEEKLQTQRYENAAVAKALDELESDAVVYKLVGPVLVRHDLADAKDNVDKRLKYIANELKRTRETSAGYRKRATQIGALVEKVQLQQQQQQQQQQKVHG